ncbi:aminotransferase class I/II-fold pyridoxal phosphate-dependent enzyme [Taibaiella soli]|uniref:8-amino-7-oxononanoate synthase n=1 Tax=Taibaiella soli TaxID=1649169 RepID=A0A2W2AKL1_9BACT|nr:8-amino-7-oxononanoate synthase [Taibaiella soli]PZF72800.1 8-amino-7-oxononanoate synthase [Taibaiella soli]
MLNAVTQQLLNKLQQRELQGNKRRLKEAGEGIDFFSNDYLGIAKTNALRESLSHTEPTASYGATGSRLLSGNYQTITDFENWLADFHDTEAALVFNSGYDANLGLLSCIADRHSTILYDEYCHASILDGIRLSQAKYSYRFEHNNVGELRERLQKHAGNGPVFVIIESVYSMEGDVAPLHEIAALTKEYNAALIVDEAHATGVFGNNGAGLIQLFRLQHDVFARVHTFGKAVGCHGAVIVGSRILKEYLVNFARSFIYTTAIPETAVQTAKHAYEWIQQNSAVRTQLHQNIHHFRSLRQSYETAYWLESAAPIQSLIIGNNNTTKALATFLHEQKILVSAVMHPTVPQGKERIRICLHSFNSKEEIELLHHHIHSFLCKKQ